MAPSTRAQTPARSARAAGRITPLPALQPKQSFAYGATGKTQLNSQIATSNAEVDEVFQKTTRKVTRGITQESMPPPSATPQLRPGRRATATKRKEPTPQLVEEEPETNGFHHDGTESLDDEEIRPGTALDPNLSYDAIPKIASPPPWPPRQSSPQPILPRRLSPSQQSPRIRSPGRSSPLRQAPLRRSSARPKSRPEFQPEDFEPADWEVNMHVIVPYIVQFFKKCVWSILVGLVSAVLFASLAVGIWAYWPLPQHMKPWRDDTLRTIRRSVGMGAYDRGPGHIEEAWWHFIHTNLTAKQIPNITIPSYQHGVNTHMFYRLENMEWNFKQLDADLKEYAATLAELNTLIPKALAFVSRDGKIEVSEEFWKAFLEKLTTDDAATAPLWDQFIENNTKRIAEIHRGSVMGDVKGILEQQQIISREQMEKHIIENNEYHQKHMNETLTSFREHLLRDMKVTATEIAKATVEQSPGNKLAKAQLGSLAYANLIENTNRRMREVNYLSIGLGAIVAPQYTSKTFRDHNPIRGIGRYLWKATGLSSTPVMTGPPNPPSTALRDWSEGAECWCAATSSDEKAQGQIAIQYPHKVWPTDFYIEHIPHSGTRDIASAPKKYEIWAQLDNQTEAVRVKRLLDERIDVNYAFECGRPPSGTSWVCINSGEYDIHYHNYVQKAQLYFDAEEIGLATRMVAFRVIQNWGAPDHSCIYRLRMTGKETEPPVWV